MQDTNAKKKSRPLISGIILLGLGILFLCNNLFDVSVTDLWPVLIIMVGGALLVGALFRNRQREELPPPPPPNIQP
jgi:uncharacterized membrane protein HdeD (DUF308 family)